MYAALAELRIKGKTASVHQGKKDIAITFEGNAPVLEITNEYGNSVRYDISESGFDGLFSNLWQFVKDNQH